MLEDVIVRPAVPGDAEALAELAARTWLAEFGSSVEAADAASEVERGRSPERFREALRERTILVAERAGAVAGFVELGAVDLPDVGARPGDAELHRLYVDTAMQGRGIGRVLTETALAHPRLAGAQRVFLQVWERNERALRLYESVGFRRAGTTRFAIGSKVMDDLVLVLERR